MKGFLPLGGEAQGWKGAGQTGSSVHIVKICRGVVRREGEIHDK